MTLLREPRAICEQAIAVLDMCSGSIEEARQLCYLNIRLGEYAAVDYWVDVATVLENVGSA